MKYHSLYLTLAPHLVLNRHQPHPTFSCLNEVLVSVSLQMPYTTMRGSLFNAAAQAPGSVSGTQWLLVTNKQEKFNGLLS